MSKGAEVSRLAAWGGYTCDRVDSTIVEVVLEVLKEVGLERA